MDYFTDVLGLLDSQDGLITVVQLKNDEIHRIFAPISVVSQVPPIGLIGMPETPGAGVKLVFW